MTNLLGKVESICTGNRRPSLNLVVDWDRYWEGWSTSVSNQQNELILNVFSRKPPCIRFSQFLWFFIISRSGSIRFLPPPPLPPPPLPAGGWDWGRSPPADPAHHQAALTKTRLRVLTQLVLPVLQHAGLHRHLLHLLHSLVAALLPHLLTRHLERGWDDRTTPSLFLTWAQSLRGILSHFVTGRPFLTATLSMWHLFTLMRRQEEAESVRQLSTLSVLQTGLSSSTVAVSVTVEQEEWNLTEHRVVIPPSHRGSVMFLHWSTRVSTSLSSSEISHTFSSLRLQAAHSSW